MTPAELESAGWQRTRPQPKPPYLTLQRGTYEIRVVWVRPGGRVIADLCLPDGSCVWVDICGKAQWTKHGDATERALASLGARTMSDGRTVREWALSPVVTP